MTESKSKEIAVVSSRRGFSVKFTKDLKQKFLDNYSITGRIIDCCRSVGMSHSAVRNHVLNDKEFAARFEEAKLTFQESIEKEVKSRAIDGWEEPVFYQGKVVGYIIKKSDRLLELLVKRHIKEYRQPTQIINTSTSNTVNVQMTELEEMPKEARDKLRELMGMMVKKPSEEQNKTPVLEGEFEETDS